jgi:hypothetical protein
VSESSLVPILFPYSLSVKGISTTVSSGNRLRKRRPGRGLCRGNATPQAADSNE